RLKGGHLSGFATFAHGHGFEQHLLDHDLAVACPLSAASRVCLVAGLEPMGDRRSAIADLVIPLCRVLWLAIDRGCAVLHVGHCIPLLVMPRKSITRDGR